MTDDLSEVDTTEVALVAGASLLSDSGADPAADIEGGQPVVFQPVLDRLRTSD